MKRFIILLVMSVVLLTVGYRLIESFVVIHPMGLARMLTLAFFGSFGLLSFYGALYMLPSAWRELRFSLYCLRRRRERRQRRQENNNVGYRRVSPTTAVLG